MNYKEQIDDYFRRFKPSNRTTELQNMIVRDMGHKYKKYIDEGFTKAETEEKITSEISNLRGHYPTLNSLERRSVRGGDPNKTIAYVFVMLYVIVSVGLYIWAPILAFLPQFAMGYCVLETTRTTVDKELRASRKQLVIGLSLLLLFQMIAMSIKYFNSEMFYAAIVIYVICFILFVFVYLVSKGQQRELPKQNIVLTVLNGPLIVKNINSRIYIIFLVSSGMMYVGHFFLVIIESLFETW